VPLKMVSDGLLQVPFEFPQHLERLRELAENYSDRRPDLADLCLIRMSEL